MSIDNLRHPRPSTTVKNPLFSRPYPVCSPVRDSSVNFVRHIRPCGTDVYTTALFHSAISHIVMHVVTSYVRDVVYITSCNDDVVTHVKNHFDNVNVIMVQNFPLLHAERHRHITNGHGEESIDIA
jgi:hypothetical protein